MSTKPAVAAGPGAGRTFRLGGDRVEVRLFGEDTGGALAIAEHTMEPGTSGPPHVHTREDELSYVVEGEFAIRVSDQVFRAAAGTFVFKPRGVPHAFWNTGDSQARLFDVICPAGSEHVFEIMADAMQAGGTPDPAKLDELRAEYGIKFFGHQTSEPTGN
jgi:quercetin dioxygenase-like cupin family protein